MIFDFTPCFLDSHNAHLCFLACEILYWIHYLKFLGIILKTLVFAWVIKADLLQTSGEEMTHFRTHILLSCLSWLQYRKFVDKFMRTILIFLTSFGKFCIMVITLHISLSHIWNIEGFNINCWQNSNSWPFHVIKYMKVLFLLLYSFNFWLLNRAKKPVSLSWITTSTPIIVKDIVAFLIC